MSAREYVAGQLIRLARKLDPNCAVDWTQLREQELSGLCYWCFEKATRDLYGVPLCDKHTDAGVLAALLRWALLADHGL